MPYRDSGHDVFTTLIGVDCAVDPRRTGLAVGVLYGGDLRFEGTRLATSAEDLVDAIAEWVRSHGNHHTVLAFDAPLGWPIGLGAALAEHRAGDSIELDANALARRATDDFIAARIGKRPLDVGADRIARTAHAALALLGQLRDRLHSRIPLAWQPGLRMGIWAIEVYPAATLLSRGIAIAGCKGKDGAAARKAITAVLRRDPSLSLDRDTSQAMIATDHLLDAVTCVIAAADFVRGDVLAPEDIERAGREGWIWVRPPVK